MAERPETPTPRHTACAPPALETRAAIPGLSSVPAWPQRFLEPRRSGDCADHRSLYVSAWQGGNSSRGTHGLREPRSRYHPRRRLDRGPQTVHLVLEPLDLLPILLIE